MVDKMPKKLRISAENVQRLRGFLNEADLDLGCRPYARERDRVSPARRAAQRRH
jgi:hypothetical protein